MVRSPLPFFACLVLDLPFPAQAVDVNQKWAGHPGGLVASWNLNSDILSKSGAQIQYWAKPQPNNAVAILIINNNPVLPHDAKVDLSLVDLFCSSGHPCSVHDIWQNKDLPAVTSST